MVHYLLETVFTDKGAEKAVEHYISFKSTEEADKYFTKMESYFNECRRYLSNKVEMPIWKQVSYRPSRGKGKYGKNYTSPAEEA